MLKDNISKLTDEKIIRTHLSAKAQNISLQIVNEVGSTNDEMKKMARDGKNEIAVLIAESQTSGKGRKGREFFSPANTGCYMSILLRPKYTAEECTLLTTMAATAVAEAIQKVTGENAQIKWINDVFIAGKKVAGILTEASVAKGGQTLEYAIVGIGVNINAPCEGFPEELLDIAGSVTKKQIKNELIAEIINIFVEYYCNLTEKKYLQRYRERLFFLGKEITVIDTDYTYCATAVDIDDMCRLIVRLQNGEEKTLFGGEISIRPSL